MKPYISSLLIATIVIAFVFLMGQTAHAQTVITYAEFDPIVTGSRLDLSNENLTVTAPFDGSYPTAATRSDLGVLEGTWYWEYFVNDFDDSTIIGGVGSSVDTGDGNWCGETTTSVGYDDTGNIRINGSSVQTGLATIAIGDVLGVALDADNEEVLFYVNGTVQGTAVSLAISDAFYACLSTYGDEMEVTANFGQSTFLFDVPVGYAEGLYETSVGPTPTEAVDLTPLWFVLYVILWLAVSSFTIWIVRLFTR